MSSVVDFAQYLNSAIQAGSAVEGTAVKVIADNGAEVGDAVFKVIQGGNGTAAEVGIATQTGAGGVVATGLAYLTMTLPEAALAIAPALGIAAGVGLYNLAPEFWNNVSEALVNAGQTVGGKVLAYWDGLNLNLNANTIEIFKNAFLNAGAFNSTTDEISNDEMQSLGWENTRTIVENTVGATLTYNNNVYTASVVSGSNIHSAVAVDSNYSQISPYYASENPFSIQFYMNGVPLGSPQNGVEITALGKTFYYLVGVNLPGTGVTVSGVTNIINEIFEGVIYARNIGYIMLYGDVTSTSTLPLQDDATYPDNNPFTDTYPDWHIHIYPPELPDITILPQVYPLAYPEIDPGITQDPAQNPEPEPFPIVIPIIIPNFPLPQPGSVEEPEIEEDPDPEPEDKEDIDDEEDGGEEPDPIDPNPPPIITPTIPVVPLPNTVNSSKLFTVYNPTSSQLDALGGYLWDSSIIAAIRDIWQEPMDGLISLQQIFVTPPTSGSHNIILGFLDSGVSAAVVSDQFVTVDCGSITIEENKKNATDYAPYTSLHLYLPFIGIVELDSNECMKSTMSVKYKVDVYTGTCLAQVSITRNEDMPHDPILYTFSGNCSQQLPLTSGNATGLLSALIGAVTAGFSAASGGGLSTLAGAQLLGNSLTHEMMHVNHSGNISANAGIMGQKKPYLIIGRRHCYDANDYNSYYGFPANKTVNIGNHQGFMRVKKCWLRTSALQEEYEEIMKLLEEGVFV